MLKYLNQSSLNSDTKFNIRTLTIVLFLFSLIAFPKLWLADLRFFPRVSLLNLSSANLNFIELGLFVTIFTSLFILYFNIKPKVLYLLILSCWGLFVLTDVLRLQVFYYWYLLVLGILIFEDKTAGQNSLRAICVGLYFWAGFSKLNFGFTNHMFPWLLGLTPGGQISPLVFWLGIGAATGEALGGILLLKPQTRPLARKLLLLMHLLISVRFGFEGFAFAPLIPWNILQFFLLLSLFSEEKTSYRGILLPVTKTGFIVRLLVFALPSTSAWGLWDDILSFRVFSGSAIQANLIVKKEFLQKEPHAEKLSRQSSDEFYLPIPHWSLYDSQHQFLSEWYFKKIFSAFCHQKNSLKDAKLVVNHKLKYGIPFRPQNRNDMIYRCWEVR